MSSSNTNSSSTPTDRQAARANLWTVSLMAAPAYHAGTLAVQAPNRHAAWDAAYAEAIERNRNGAETVPQGVALAPLTRSELNTVHSFLSGRGLGSGKRAASGLFVREHRHGGPDRYDAVRPLMEPRDLCELDPDVMARAGAQIDRYRKLGDGSGSPTGYRRPVAESEAHGIRHAAREVPYAFHPTGRVAVEGWWPESTAPTFPDTPEGREEAARVVRLHRGSRASLVLDGQTVATIHGATATMREDRTRPLLRVLSPGAAEKIGPRAERILTALRSTAQLGRPEGWPDVETESDPRGLVAAMMDPRDHWPPLAPVLRETAPTLADIHPELTDDGARALVMSAQWERVRGKLYHEPERLWSLATDDDTAGYFNTPAIPTDTVGLT